METGIEVERVHSKWGWRRLLRAQAPEFTAGLRLEDHEHPIPLMVGDRISIVHNLGSNT